MDNSLIETKISSKNKRMVVLLNFLFSRLFSWWSLAASIKFKLNTLEWCIFFNNLLCQLLGDYKIIINTFYSISFIVWNELSKPQGLNQNDNYQSWCW